jgi:hypothetical protein
MDTDTDKKRESTRWETKEKRRGAENAEVAFRLKMGFAAFRRA